MGQFVAGHLVNSSRKGSRLTLMNGVPDVSDEHTSVCSNSCNLFSSGKMPHAQTPGVIPLKHMCQRFQRCCNLYAKDEAVDTM